MGFSISSGVFLKDRNVFSVSLTRHSLLLRAQKPRLEQVGALQHNTQKKKRKSNASLTLGKIKMNKSNCPK